MSWMKDNFHWKALLEVKPTIGENKSVVQNIREEVVSAGMRISQTRVVQNMPLLCGSDRNAPSSFLSARIFKIVHFLETVKYVKPPV